MICVAILGAGIGKAHLEGYRKLPAKFSVDVMCDLDPDRAAAATGKDPDIQIVTDIADVVSNPEIDIVDICLPPHLHVPVALQALAAGKHVICEKPIARSIPEIEQLNAARKSSEGSFFPVFQYRFGVATAQLKALIDAGLAGKAFSASAETHWDRQSDYYDIPWRGTWAGESGGSILGHAIHAHDLLCRILGPVDEVHAYLDTRVNDIETEDCAAISMRMKSGALVTSSVTLGSAGNTTRLKFCFEGFTATSGSSPYAPAEDVWTFTARGQMEQAKIDAVLATVEPPLPGFAGFLDAIADAIAGKRGREVTFEDGCRSIELVTAMYQSSREHRPVKLPITKEDSLYDGWIPV